MINDRESKRCSRLSDLPTFTRMLTGITSDHLIQVPRQLAEHIAIIEVGVKRVQILYTDINKPDLLVFLTQCKGLLLASQYRIDPQSLCCTPALLAQLNDFSSTGEQPAAEMVLFDGVRSQSKQLFQSWIVNAVGEGATDVHIQITYNKAEVKLRIDGSLELLRDENGGVYTAQSAERAVAWAFNNASFRGSNSNSQFVAMENLYCMIEPQEIMNRRISLRFQSIRGALGVKVVCRLLDVSPNQETLAYERLGYEPSQIAILEDASSTSAGFVLFAGVTGSGKTTSLKTFIETHPLNGKEAFYSIEDPIEYPLRGVHQVPMQRDIIDKHGSALKYGEIIAALMRADPGCVMMGEIRDNATASAGQQIVETGHLACATVHAHLISGVIPRLTDSEIGMSRYVLTNPHVLSAIVYQSLIPKLCEHCRIPIRKYPSTSKDAGQAKSFLGFLETKVKLDGDLFYLHNPLGCDRCRFRGTSGLTVVAELYSPDKEWLNLIRDRKDQEAIEYYQSTSDGNLLSGDMSGKTVFEHTLYKASRGLIDPRQCLRFESLTQHG
ncbi:MAG: Flp pilus assembly complex ATPase component TadA [Burkholderiales bacterium]|nr:Flp pilus assembly complex ATPase component TadA [Burkholderiales bacterium]